MSLNCISLYISGSILLQMYKLILMKRQLLTPKGITLDCGRDIILIIKTTQTFRE